jgi:hypothetical protein
MGYYSLKLAIMSIAWPLKVGVCIVGGFSKRCSCGCKKPERKSLKAK